MVERQDGDRRWGLGTQAVWAGERTPRRILDHAAVVPIVRSVTFEYDDLDEWSEVAAGRREGHVYSRNTNPTVSVFEAKVRALEGAEAATSFATGMAAVSNTLLALLSPGDRVVTVNDTYGGTNKLFTESLPRFGIEVDMCPTDDQDRIIEAVGLGCAVVYLESPTNPTLKVLDLPHIAVAAHDVAATLVVDNTFASPINQRPLELGADLVVHSATKFLGGHSDALGGVACGPAELVGRLFHFREIHGAALDPEAAYMLLRGIKTLELRVERQNENALRIARHLEEHEAVERVFYPGLPSHPGHEVARRQMSGFGGVLSFSLVGGLDTVRRFLPHLELAHRAASLGSVSTLVGPPAVTSHVELTSEERAAAGIPEGLVRYSVGIEDADDLIRDLDHALEKAVA